VQKAYRVSPDLVAKLQGRRKEHQGMKWVDMGGAITGNREGTEEEKEGIAIHSPHMRSPPIFQLCLSL